MNTLLFGFVIVGLASQALTAPQTAYSASESVQQVKQFNLLKNATQSFVTTFANAGEDKMLDALIAAIKIVFEFQNTIFTQATINKAYLAHSDIAAYLKSGNFFEFMLRFLKDILDSVEFHKHIVPSAVEITKLIKNFVDKRSGGKLDISKLI